MKAEAWRRVSELFTRARELPAEERAGVLGATGVDPDVRAEVEGLLRFDDDGTGGMTGPDPGSALGGLALLRTDGLGEGARVGSYRLVRRLGRGASGEVYEALQDQPSRTVALKIIPLPLAGSEGLRRFRDEAAALARLRHPGVAQVFEAGTARVGGTDAAFVAMELVPHARPITEACASLPLRERVRLMMRVCEAVHHAHLRGVIHRDLKPANILVEGSPPGGRARTGAAPDRTDNPEPKVIDFGVARLLDRARAEAETTLPGQLIGTPQYMAPEQASGDSDGTDVRADVYTLGVVLYRVLSGRLPYEVPPHPAGAARVIGGAMPPAPSSHEPALKGDLDAVVLTALEKDPRLRYQSAAALGADLQRWLEHRPIAVKPVPLRRRALLRAKRNPAATALVVLLVMALAGGASVGIAGGVEAARQRAVAVAVTAYLTEMLTSPGVSEKGVNVRVIDVLDDAVAGLTRLQGRPEVQDGVRHALAESYEALGEYTKAHAQYDILLQRARERFGGSDKRTVSAMADLAGSCFDLGEYARAEELLNAVLAYRVRRFGEKSLPAAQSLNDLALVLFDTQRNAEAEEMMRRAVEIRRAAPGGGGLETAKSLHNLGVFRRRAGDNAKAVEYFEAAAAIQERLNGARDRDLANTRRFLALALMDMGDLDRAEDTARGALNVLVETVGERHPNTAGAWVALARIRKRAGDLAAAEEHFARAADIYREALGADHPYTRTVLDELETVRTPAQGR